MATATAETKTTKASKTAALAPATTPAPARVPKPSKAELSRHEKVIDAGLKSFVDVGNALKAIQVGELYRAAGFETFDAYCAGKWGFTRQRGYQLMEAAGTAQLLSTQVDAPVPNEKIARELAPLVKADPEKAARLWAQASADGAKVTGPGVRESVRTAMGQNGSRPRGTAQARPRNADAGNWAQIRDFASTFWLVLDPASVAAEVSDGDHTIAGGFIEEGVEWIRAFADALANRAASEPAEETDTEFEREPVESA